jgi:DNA-binding LacI/PurR family transcriptional regulator
MLLEQHASGVVFAGGLFHELAAPHDHYRLLRRRGVPVVLINAAVDNLDFPCVATDDASAVTQAFTSAVALLVNQMETVVTHPEELLFEPELVVRGSTGPAPVRGA